MKYYAMESTFSLVLFRTLDFLRYQALILYRQLFSIIWLSNVAVLLAVLCIPSVSLSWLANIALVNLAIAVVIRQDFVINILFAICCSVPRSWPLAIRHRMARIYHLGGVHSGCATAAVGWFIGSFVYDLHRCISSRRQFGPSAATLALSCTSLLLLVAMVLFAYPALRKRYHDVFEFTHRFSGWTALMLVWIKTILSLRDSHPQVPLCEAMSKSPSFWLLITITLSIATSWVFLKRVPVNAEILSEHAIQ